MQRIDAIREGRRAKHCEIVLKIKGRRKACPFVLGSLYVIRDKVASRAWVRTMLIRKAYCLSSRVLGRSLTRCDCTTNAYLAILQKCHFEGKTNIESNISPTRIQQGFSKKTTLKHQRTNIGTTRNQHENNMKTT